MTPEVRDPGFGYDRVHGHVVRLRIYRFEPPKFVTNADGQRLLDEVRQGAIVVPVGNPIR